MTAILICLLFGGLALLLGVRGTSGRETRIVIGAFVAHVLSSFALVIYQDYIYGGSDMTMYVAHGKQMARLMHYDFFRWAPEVVKLALQRDNHLPVAVMMEGKSTGSMSAIAGFLMYLTDDSLMAGCLLVGFVAFLGRMSMFKAIADQLTPIERVPVLIGTLLVPSALFWSAGIVKEGLAIGFMGFLISGVISTARGRIWGIAFAVMGAVGVGLVKPYINFVVVLAFSGALLARRKGTLSLGWKVLGVVVAVGGLFVTARFFPEYGLGHLAQNVVQSRANFALAGGSYTSLGDEDDDVAEATLGRQLRYAPLAVLTALFRPLLVEVRNGAQLVAGLEMTVILVILVVLLRRLGPRALWRDLTAAPWSAGCVVFVLAFSLPVGLATTNLGALSRYRIPMLAMYASALLAARARLREREQIAAAASSVIRGPRRRFRTSRAPGERTSPAPGDARGSRGAIPLRRRG